MKFFLLTFNTILILLTGCSAIPTTRYEQNPKSENSKEEVKQLIKPQAKSF
jgi:starvation-inducible outer membrane lipoprotein